MPPPHSYMSAILQKIRTPFVVLTLVIAVGLTGYLFTIPFTSQENMQKRFDEFVEEHANKDAIVTARNIVEKMGQKKIKEVYANLDDELKTKTSAKELLEISAFFPLKLSEEKIVGYEQSLIQSAQGNGASQYGITFEFQVDNTWYYSQVVLNKSADDSAHVVSGLHSRTASASLAEQHSFSLKGKSLTHYFFLMLVYSVPLFIIFTLVLYLRTPVEKKILWALFIAIGLGGIAFNWTTGEILFPLLQLLFFGSGISTTSLYSPWILKTSLPLGAIIFLMRRKKMMGVKKIPEENIEASN